MKNNREDQYIEHVLLRVPAAGDLSTLINERLTVSREQVRSTETEIRRLEAHLEGVRRAAVKGREEVNYWESQLDLAGDARKAHKAHEAENSVAIHAAAQDAERDALFTEAQLESFTIDELKEYSKQITRKIKDASQRDEEPAQREMLGHLDSDSPNEAPEPQEASQKVCKQTMNFLLRVYEDTDVPLLERNVKRAVSEVLREHYSGNGSVTGVTLLLHDGYGHVKWDGLRRDQTIEVKITIGFSKPEDFDVLHNRLYQKLVKL